MGVKLTPERGYIEREGKEEGERLDNDNQGGIMAAKTAAKRIKARNRGNQSKGKKGRRGNVQAVV